jgi:hypothetical protein
MSMQPQSWPEPAEEITKAVLAMYAGRRAPLPVVVRDELDELFADAEFAQAFGVRGKPGWSPGRLAMVTVFQMVEDLTDVQAAEAVRLRLDWKYALVRHEAPLLRVGVKGPCRWSVAAGR